MLYALVRSNENGHLNSNAVAAVAARSQAHDRTRIADVSRSLRGAEIKILIFLFHGKVVFKKKKKKSVNLSLIALLSLYCMHRVIGMCLGCLYFKCHQRRTMYKLIFDHESFATL